MRGFARYLLPLGLCVGSAQAAFKIIGYVPSWAGNVDQVQYGKLTHINYAFALPADGSGALQALDNPNKLRSLVTQAHASGVKVLVSVGGWSDGGALVDPKFEALAANATSRAAFVQNCVNLLTTYNLDGIDIDWEYPDAGASANNYLQLMTQLGTEMHSRGKLLTSAVISDGSTGAGIVAGAFAVVDFLNIMAYDGDGTNHSPYSLAVSSLNYWVKTRGLDQDKAVLGVPFYGRDPETPYNDLVAQDAQAPNKDNVGSVYYNGIPTMKQKTQLAHDQGGGVMIWELSQDTRDQTSLLSAIYSLAAPWVVPLADRPLRFGSRPGVELRILTQSEAVSFLGLGILPAGWARNAARFPLPLGKASPDRE